MFSTIVWKRLLLGALLLLLTGILLVVFLSGFSTVLSFISPQTTVKSYESPKDTLHPSILSRLGLVPQRKKAQTIVGVMIENHEDARPHQEGLADALLVEEFLVEGFISRFVALFNTQYLPSRVGPVRSLRPYFIDSIRPWVSAIFYAGGSPDALKHVEEVNLRHFNGLGLPNHFVREEWIPAPHDLFLPRWNLRDLLSSIDIRHIQWPPYPTGPAISGEEATVITVNFFSPVHNVLFTFDPLSQSYSRRNGDVLSDAHPANVLILEIPIKNIGEFGRLEIDTTGMGNVLFFRSSTVQKGQWYKASINEPFVFSDSKGNPLIFAQGQTWMMVLPELERVRWKE